MRAGTAMVAAIAAVAMVAPAQRAGAQESAPAQAQPSAQASGAQGANANQTPSVPQPTPPPHNEHLPAIGIPFVPGVSGGLPPQPTVEDALAELVHASGTIFAGEIYAIRMPAGEQAKGTAHTAKPGVVDIEFRVDQGVRNASIGDPFILHESEAVWRAQPGIFQPHQRAVYFLTSPDEAGLAAPAGGASGILPIDDQDQVDLAHLHALVRRQDANSPQPAPSSNAGTAQAGSAPQENVTDVTSPAGEATLQIGTDNGGMPELHAKTIPYLSLMRDVYVLVGAESAGKGGT
jgi:hypothetical protein